MRRPACPAQLKGCLGSSRVSVSLGQQMENVDQDGETREALPGGMSLGMPCVRSPPGGHLPNERRWIFPQTGWPVTRSGS